MDSLFTQEQEAAFDALSKMLDERNKMRALIDFLHEYHAIDYRQLERRGVDSVYLQMARELNAVQQINKANEEQE